MSEPQGPRGVMRSLGAVLAGIAVGVALSIGTDQALHASGVFPPAGQPMSGELFVLATAYRTVYGVAGSYATARLAPNRPMMHALVLGGLGLVVCVVGSVATWNRGPEFGPHWYPLALVALAMPQSWLGAKLRKIQSQSRPTKKVLGGSRSERPKLQVSQEANYSRKPTLMGAGSVR